MITVTVTHHMSHSFSYLSSLPLVTDPIAVASNDCARDRLHKDRCTQAFGRNTLSKPHIMCSSGLRSVPFFALAISRASLNSGLSREHVCCHVFPPAHVFPSGLGNTPVTEIGGSVVDFPYISLYMHPIRPQLWSPIVKTSLLTTTCKKTAHL